MLSASVVFKLGVTIAFASFSLFVLLLILQKICAKTNILLAFANLKARHIVVMLTVSSVLLFVLLATLLKVCAKKDISSILVKLKSCTTLTVHNSFYDRKAYKKASENITIKNREIIGKLTDVMANAQYELVWMPGSFATEEFIDVYVHKNDVQISEFRVIAGNILEIGKVSKPHRYMCPDRGLLDKVREVTGARGDWLGTGRQK